MGSYPGACTTAVTNCSDSIVNPLSHLAKGSNGTKLSLGKALYESSSYKLEIVYTGLLPIFSLASLERHYPDAPWGARST